MIDIEKLAIENGFIPHEADDGECYAEIETLKQFAEALLEDKEREIERLNKVIEINHALMQTDDKEIISLQATINDLREALEGLVDFNLASGIPCDKAEQALASTPAQSLQAHDNEVIEHCACECENHWDVDSAAEAIRKLKV